MWADPADPESITASILAHDSGLPLFKGLHIYHHTQLYAEYISLGELVIVQKPFLVNANELRPLDTPHLLRVEAGWLLKFIYYPPGQYAPQMKSIGVVSKPMGVHTKDCRLLMRIDGPVTAIKVFIL